MGALPLGPWGDVEGVRAAMAEGADVNWTNGIYPCLAVAVRHQNEEVVSLLLSSPAIQVNQKDLRGCTLHSLAFCQ